jgi:hypothetical protein
MDGTRRDGFGANQLDARFFSAFGWRYRNRRGCIREKLTDAAERRFEFRRIHAGLSPQPGEVGEGMAAHREITGLTRLRLPD